MKNFEKDMKHQVRFGRIKKTMFWIFSTLFIFISFAQNGFGQTAPSVQIVNFDSSLAYFLGGSVSVISEPKLVFRLHNVFNLELSEDLECDFDWLEVVEEKLFVIKSMGLKNIYEDETLIDLSDLNKTFVHFFDSSMFYFNIKLMHHVG